MNAPLVVIDPEIMGGEAVFAGSRLPISTVLASLASGYSLEKLAESWPFLTEAHVAAAREHLRMYPTGGARRKTVAEDFPGAKVVSSKVVRRPRG
ncbi:DUF433 domain-containing protein [Roseateles noduli]|uniref:DUF433 domain-containing protein n=1 Tax=Roseateles noduli TaxID=2052484 RepID=UPI003D651BC7